jgi:plasmid stability protein
LAQLTDRAMKRVNFDIPEEQHRMLKVYAAKHGKTIKDLLSDYISNLKLEAEQ